MERSWKQREIRTFDELMDIADKIPPTANISLSGADHVDADGKRVMVRCVIPFGELVVRWNKEIQHHSKTVPEELGS